MAGQSVSLTNLDTSKESIVSLPQLDSQIALLLDAMTESLGVHRNVLASDAQIEHVWRDLPELLSRIPSESRDGGLARLCIAIRVGLFDSAINYAWNAVVLELRRKMHSFGIHIVPQIVGNSDFDESTLINLKDSELLRLCLNLNLISENGYFMLDQCRAIRNNFSSSHPSKGSLNDYELLNFLSRVCQYALETESNPQGVDVQTLIRSIESSEFSEQQRSIWCDRLEKTYEAQRSTVFGMLHGMYCDPDKSEKSRVNAIALCSRLHERYFTPSVKSTLINRHHDYIAKGDSARQEKSRLFFEELAMLSLLSESERHAMISNACKSLLSVHNAYDNFHNEPPFAERLFTLSSQQQVPETAKVEFVETVITCSVGNPYGTSDRADINYIQLVKAFSAEEIRIMLKIPNERTVVANRIDEYPRCKRKYRELVKSLDPSSIPASLKTNYERALRK